MATATAAKGHDADHEQAPPHIADRHPAGRALMTAGNYITLGIFAAGVLLAVYGFLYRMDKRVDVIENRCTVHQPVIDSIAALNSRLDQLTADTATFWRILGPSLAGIIHSPTAATRDELVDKLFAGSIDADECRMLIALLREAIDAGHWSGDKKLAGVWVLARACMTLSRLAGPDSEECA
jgi:hypothetical protein